MATVFTIANTFAPGAVILAEEQNENWEDAKDYFDALSSGNNFITGAILTAPSAILSVVTELVTK